MDSFKTLKGFQVKAILDLMFEIFDDVENPFDTKDEFGFSNYQNFIKQVDDFNNGDIAYILIETSLETIKSLY